MRANRIDGNHKEVVKEFRLLGWHVWDVHDLKECCDIEVWKNGHSIRIEIKDGKKPPSARKLSKGEIIFRDLCKENTIPWELVTGLDDVNKINKEYV